MSKKIVVLFLAIIGLALGDVYMHNPRGSNNRYRGDTNNQNRAFESENNANGGYGWGPEMTYYEGSLLQIEWTAQHGCGQGHPNTECEIILQYMCGPWVRDGTEVTRPPDDADDDDPRWVQHEPPSFYRDCATRDRNKGLFTADRNVGRSAENTRQHNANRHGWECHEERDYYPYWHPSPWKDIAVLTSGPLHTRCPYYKANSQNRHSKFHCIKGQNQRRTYDFSDPKNIPKIWGEGAQANNEVDCLATGNSWVEVPAWNIDELECIPHPLTRDNHLGNADFGANTARYLWVIPTPTWDNPNAPASERRATCVLRLRYNISSGDYSAWGHVDNPGTPMIDHSYNGLKSPVKTNPKITYGYDAQMQPRNLTLALNTAQYGRTFQDRSHTFWIKPRPAGILPTDRIFNLNVRGKRGNIVQTYPSVEYDFVPTHLRCTRGDYIHFQWTGSDTNPANQAGEGTDRTDRSNIVMLKDNNRRTNYPHSFDKVETDGLIPADVAFRLAHLDQPAVCQSITQTDCCLTYEQLEQKHNGNANNINQDPQNCAKLNYAGPYFNGGLVQMKKAGTMHYMSTRNNNYTNRSQKGTITVSDRLPPAALAIVVTGVAAFAAAAVLGVGVFAAKYSPRCANIFAGVKL